MKKVWVLAALCWACGKDEDFTEEGHRLRTEKDQFGIITCSEATADTRCYTQRAIIGVSMGAGGAGQLGFARPELFDTVGMLGVPIVDWVYMHRNIERSYLGGFCEMDQILANLDTINDPAGPAFCGPARGQVKITPDGRIMEPDQDYNHWYRWIDEGRGGGFGRNKLRESFQDITLAFGNAGYYNPESPYLPPGVPTDYANWTDAEKCSEPLVLQGVRHWRYNPTGEYPVIAFCDTRTNSGEFDPTKPSELPMDIALSVDYNRNGLRDAAEPILVMAHERYQDIGVRADDDYDWDKNPLGTKENWRHDEGEPFEDFGLDGVPDTGDFGEGNGRWDQSPNIDNYMAQNPRTMLEKMPQGHLDRLNIYADAGIRDFLMSAAATNWLWGALTARTDPDTARDWDDFSPLTPQLSDFDFLAVDYSAKGIGRHAYIRYGSADATERQISRGDGHHVGSADQVLKRFLVSLAFIQDRFLDRDTTLLEVVGEVTTLIQPKTFRSAALGRDREYGVVLPPGYDLPENANKRYPVVYFLHGQGMESSSLLASAIIFFGYMAGTTDEDKKRARQSDWAKFILIFPDSKCDVEACHEGNFNANHRGVTGEGPRYADSIYELIAHIEGTYRTAIPVEVPVE